MGVSSEDVTGSVFPSRVFQNDSGFLSMLHEVYLQVLTKNKDNHNL